MADASGFVARLACPACAFPIGIRESDRKKQRVRCPVCGQHAAVTLEAPASDGPFREGSESLALVATKPPPQAGPGEASLVSPPPLYTLARANRYGRYLWTAYILYGIAVIAGYVAGVSLSIPGLAGLLTILLLGWGRPSWESGRLDGRALVRSVSTPFARKEWFPLQGATVHVEQRGTGEGHIVVVEQDGHRLVIGDQTTLALDEATAIADRLRDATA